MSYYARWDDEKLVAGQTLDFAGLGGDLPVARTPERVGFGWPGVPTQLWRIAGGAAERQIVLEEPVPTWRWLGRRGDEVLRIFEPVWQVAADDVMQLTAALSTRTSSASSRWPFPDYLTDGSAGVERAATPAAVNVAWLLRDRLLDYLRAEQPAGLLIKGDIGCGGEFEWVEMLEPWLSLEAAALAAVIPLVIRVPRH